jgi:hypothetical protein
VTAPTRAAAGLFGNGSHSLEFRRSRVHGSGSGSLLWVRGTAIAAAVLPQQRPKVLLSGCANAVAFASRRRVLR